MLACAMLARGLYAIVDVEITIRAGFDVLSFAQAILDARPAVLQLRAKGLGGREHLRLLEAIVRRAESVNVPIYANDRPDLAILAGCAGVHVGQSDVGVPEIRRLDARLGTGLSTANVEQLEEAIRIGPDYIAVGPVFPTPSKLDAEPAVGLDFLRDAHDRASRASIPLVAIGGIDHERAAQIAPYVLEGAAIGALIPKTSRLDWVTTLARSLHEALGGT